MDWDLITWTSTAKRPLDINLFHRTSPHMRREISCASLSGITDHIALCHCIVLVTIVQDTGHRRIGLRYVTLSQELILALDASSLAVSRSGLFRGDGYFERRGSILVPATRGWRVCHDHLCWLSESMFCNRDIPDGVLNASTNEPAPLPFARHENDVSIG